VGPGAYQVNTGFGVRKCRKREKRVVWKKKKNAPPSIPSHDLVYGYKDRNGKLVR